jgi:uncharacterized protein
MAMKRLHRKRSIAFWLLLAELLLVPVRAVLAEAAKSLPKPTDYVNDYAHVLSPEGATRLDRICMELNHSQANAQFAIVTIHNLDGDDAADYANQLEERWKIGRKGSDRGVLVLLAVDNHKWRIDVGYGLEGILNDAKIGDIGRSMVPYLRVKDYDNAVLLAVGQLAQIIATDAHITLTDQPALAQQPAQQLARSRSSRDHIPIPILVILVLIMVLIPSTIVVLLVGTILRGRRLGFRTSGAGGVGDSGSGDSGGGSSDGGNSGGGDSGPSDGGSFGGGGAGGDW